MALRFSPKGHASVYIVSRGALFVLAVLSNERCTAEDGDSGEQQRKPGEAEAAHLLVRDPGNRERLRRHRGGRRCEGGRGRWCHGGHRRIENREDGRNIGIGDLRTGRSRSDRRCLVLKDLETLGVEIN